MAQFSVNAQRFDPYKNFKFRVKWDGRYVAGVSQIGALNPGTEAAEHREGGGPGTVRTSPFPKSHLISSGRKRIRKGLKLERDHL